MLRNWYIPSSSGDFRLELPSDDKADPSKTCLLTVEDPTPAKMLKLGNFLAKCRQRHWIDKAIGVGASGRTEISIRAPMAKAGPLLAGETMPTRGVLTAVRSQDGTLLAVADETEPEKIEKAAADPKADVVATTKRPTSCCPNPIEGPLKRSSKVLREFCTPAQWTSWVRDGYLLCHGHLTGHLYRICHRHHPIAIEEGKITRDLTNNLILHCYDWSIPPAEEVLGIKMILENREPWLRTPSTMVGPPVFPEPSGLGVRAGTWDASFFHKIADGVGKVLGAPPQKYGYLTLNS